MAKVSIACPRKTTNVYLFLIISFYFVVAPNKAWEIEWVKKLKIVKIVFVDIYCF